MNSDAGLPVTRTGTSWVALALAIAVVGVAIHIGAVVGGPAWFAFFHAPPRIVASARAGTWPAPVAALVIAALMATCAAYAASALRLLRPLPLLRPALAGMAAVCLGRAFLLLPLAWQRPDLVDIFEVVSAVVWCLAGVGFAVGGRTSRPRPAAVPV